MIFVPVGNKLVRSRVSRFDSVPTVSEIYFHRTNKKSKSRKERVEELRRYLNAQEKKLARSKR